MISKVRIAVPISEWIAVSLILIRKRLERLATLSLELAFQLITSIDRSIPCTWPREVIYLIPK